MDKSIFHDIDKVSREKLKEVLLNHKTINSGSDILFLIIDLVLQKNNAINLGRLYNLLGIEEFLKVVSCFEGEKISFPTRKELKDLLELALVYYYREIEMLDWEEIKKILPFNINSYSFGQKISGVNDFIKNAIKSKII